MYKPGTRVIAISHSEGDTLYIFGYGVYEGNFLPAHVDMDTELAEMRQVYDDMKAKDPDGMIPEPDDTKLREIVGFIRNNPRIKLDSGKIVWGYECWWGDIEGFEVSKEKAHVKNIVEIDIDEARVKAKAGTTS